MPRVSEHLDRVVEQLQIGPICFDGANDTLQNGVCASRIVRDDRNAERRRTPRILVIDFCDRHVERVPDPGLDTRKDGSLLFERTRFRICVEKCWRIR